MLEMVTAAIARAGGQGKYPQLRSPMQGFP
jgi:hypothetical protein